MILVQIWKNDEIMWFSKTWNIQLQSKYVNNMHANKQYINNMHANKQLRVRIGPYTKVLLDYLTITIVVTALKLIQDNCKLHRANTVMTTRIVSKYHQIKFLLGPPVSFKNK